MMQREDTTETNAKLNSTEMKTEWGYSSHQTLRTYKRYISSREREIILKNSHLKPPSTVIQIQLTKTTFIHGMEVT